MGPGGSRTGHRSGTCKHSFVQAGTCGPRPTGYHRKWCPLVGEPASGSLRGVGSPTIPQRWRGFETRLARASKTSECLLLKEDVGCQECLKNLEEQTRAKDCRWQDVLLAAALRKKSDAAIAAVGVALCGYLQARSQALVSFFSCHPIVASTSFR